MAAKTAVPVAGFIDLLPDAICIVDAAGKFVHVSAACERVFGYTPQEMIGRQVIELVAPDDRERTLRAASEIMSGRPLLNFENRYIRKNGEIVHILWSARWSEADQLRIAVARDITERKRAELMQAAVYAISEAAHAAEDLPTLFRLIHDIIARLLSAPDFSVALLDEQTRRLDFPFHTDGSSLPQDAAAFCGEVIRSGKLLQPSAAPADRAARWLGVPLNTHKGTIGALMLRGSGDGYSEKDKELLQFVSTQIATAIERKRLNEQLQNLAHYDGLTGLPNRALLDDRLKMALARTRRGRGHMALLYLDLDKFKQVNDSFGHAAGDLLLQQVGARLKSSVRRQDTVARVGGDEFVVLLEGLCALDQAAVVANKIQGAIAPPIRIDAHEVTVEASIGIAYYPEHGEDARQLLRHADEAMFTIKKRRAQAP